MVVSLEVIAAGGCYGVQLVVGEGMAELSARRGKRVIESVAGIVHLIYPEGCFQASFVETGIVGYEGNGGYLVADVICSLHIREEYINNPFLQLLPNLREHGGIVRIALCDAMHTLTEVAVVVWLRLYKAVERVGHLPITNHNHAHGADTRRLLVSRLEVDGDKVSEHALISQILTDKHYDMPSLAPAVTQEVDVAANALRGVAVMASAVDSARRVDVKPLGVNG